MHLEHVPKKLGPNRLISAHQTTVWNIPQVNTRTGNVRMPRLGRKGPSLNCSVEKRIKPFQDNVPQRTIARNWVISIFPVHRVIKRFRESGETTARKRQGLKATLNARNGPSLRRHGIKNDIATRAQEHFRKPMAVVTVWHPEVWLETRRAKQKPFLNNTMRRRRLPWASGYLR